MPQRLPGGTIGFTLRELVRLLCNLRDKYYPWMHILYRADGTVVVTLSLSPEEGRRESSNG
ncbi:hypothetical protein [Nocardia sp. NPDC046763]|uniref:hypothetical protein n=1 Tax=Nocardia sp. NPDC046763 TaxID=3155256 RepID=UPI0033D77740